MQMKDSVRKKQSHSVCQFPSEKGKRRWFFICFSRQDLFKLLQEKKKLPQLHSFPANDLGERGKERETIHLLWLESPVLKVFVFYMYFRLSLKHLSLVFSAWKWPKWSDIWKNPKNLLSRLQSLVVLHLLKKRQTCYLSCVFDSFFLFSSFLVSSDHFPYFHSFLLILWASKKRCLKNESYILLWKSNLQIHVLINHLFAAASTLKLLHYFFRKSHPHRSLVVNCLQLHLLLQTLPLMSQDV